MKQIRQNVFETNSSSSHSISIAGKSKEFMVDLSMVPDEQGVILIEGDGFGWEWDKYNDAFTKARYCFFDAGKDKDGTRYKMLMDVIKEQTGAIAVVVGKEGEYGGIDHQSKGTSAIAFKSKATLRNFIFNKNSWLFTGNDNETMSPDFKDVPLYKDGKEIKVVHQYSLTLDGCLHKRPIKFKKKPTYDQLLKAFYNLIGYANWTNGKFNFSSWSSTEEHFEFREYITGKKSIDMKNERIMLVSDQFKKDMDAACEYILKDKESIPNEYWAKYNKAKKKKIEELLKKADPKHVMFLPYHLEKINEPAIASV